MKQKIGLVTPSPQSHRTAEETLGLGYLSATLRAKNYEVVIVDGWLESLSSNEIIEKLSIGGAPSIVGISCYRSNIEQAIKILTAIRNTFGFIPVICGGYGPTFHEDLFLKSGFTAVIRGEAEHIIVPLIENLTSGNNLKSIPGIAFLDSGHITVTKRSEPVTDLNKIPFPRRDTIYSTIAQKNNVHMCTSRGCEGHCSFCSIFSFTAGAPGQSRWRQRSIINIVDEISYLYEYFGVTNLKFVDDSFLETSRNIHWVERFQKEISRRHLSIKFRTQVRADRLNVPIIKTLKEAGWFSTSIGVENFSTTALKRMMKSALNTDNIAAIEALSEEKIYTQMGMIMFDPNTTITELFENLKYLKIYRWPITKGIFTEMYAARGTMLEKRLTQEGLLKNDPIMQNHVYLVQDPNANRVYKMLKKWHQSYSTIYDWTIDSLTAPKVLSREDYENVYNLYRRLQTLDLELFERVILRVINYNDDDEDMYFVDEFIKSSLREYTFVNQEIKKIYDRNYLCYQAVPNPFIGSL